MGEGLGLYTYYFASNPNKLISTLPLINNASEYDNLKTQYNSESNSLENIVYHIFNNLNTYKDVEFDELSLQSFDHKDYSRVEYFTILSTNLSNYFTPYFYISNSQDSRTVYYKVYKNNQLVIDRTLEINQTFSFWDLIRFEEDTIVEF